MKIGKTIIGVVCGIVGAVIALGTVILAAAFFIIVTEADDEGRDGTRRTTDDARGRSERPPHSESHGYVPGV